MFQSSFFSGARRRLVLASSLACLAVSGVAAAQGAFPERAVRIVTPFPVGSGVDVNLRLMSERLSKSWGKPVIIENRPGAAGFIAIEAARRAPADGYTLLQLDSAQMAAQPFLFKKLPYSLKRDFMPITTMFRNDFFLAVPANSPYGNVGELLAAAKAAPERINYGSWFIGSPGHLGGAMLDQAAGTSMTHIAYKEMTQLYTAVANGEVPWAFGTIGSMNALYRGGKLKLLAVAAPQRVAGFESIPTMGEAGGPAGFELSAWVGILAPRGVPSPVAEKIRRDIETALSDPELRTRYVELGYAPMALSPAAFDRLLEKDSERFGQIIQRLNISLD